MTILEPGVTGGNRTAYFDIGEYLVCLALPANIGMEDLKIKYTHKETAESWTRVEETCCNE